MDEMTVTKAQLDLAAATNKAGQIAKLLQDMPSANFDTTFLLNLRSLAQISAHVLYRSLVRINEAKLLPIDGSIGLFEDQKDKALAVAQLEELVEEMKNAAIGHAVQDDTGQGNFEQPSEEDVPDDLPSRVLALIHTAGEDGIELGAVHSVFQNDETVADTMVDAIWWALANLGRTTINDGAAVAHKPSTTLDVLAMIEAEGKLGTSKGGGLDLDAIYLTKYFTSDAARVLFEQVRSNFVVTEGELSSAGLQLDGKAITDEELTAGLEELVRENRVGYSITAAAAEENI